jgi:hypothetical protein
MATDIDVKNNGHSEQAIPAKAGAQDVPDKTAEIPEDVKAFLGFDSYKNAFTTQNMSSAIEKLVERGDKIEDLIMRGQFWTSDHMNSWVKLLRKAIHFNDKELEQLLMNHLAGCTSIGGERIDILLRAVIGQYQAQKKTSTGAKIRNFLGMDKAADGSR